MPILNYTTGIEVQKTIAEIQETLVTHGASAIRADYDNGQVVAVSFQVVLDGKQIAFRLPSDWRPVLKVLEMQKEKLRRAGRRSKMQANEDQARRVAWRILKDWVEAQMALVEIRMASMDQVFLPYALTRDGRTMYEHVQTTNLLSAPKP